MIEFLRKHRDSALVAAILTSIFSVVGSGVSAYYSYQASKITQDRQTRLEQLSKFDASSSQIIETSSAFITAINENKDVEAARQKLGAVLATQIYEVDNITKFYDGKVSKIAKEYQDALIEMNQVAKKTTSVTEMRIWTESFGRVLDVKSVLSKEPYLALGVELKGARRASI